MSVNTLEKKNIQESKSSKILLFKKKSCNIDIPFPAQKNPKFTFIDLFAGIGGMRIAFQNLGGKCVFSSEIDKLAQKTYAINFGDIPSGDITQINEKEIPNHDILVGGFPCQAFSIAGKRGGFNDTRGTLFFDVARIIKAKQPKAFFLENVKGLTNHRGGKTLATILNVLRNDLGYIVPEPQIINAKNFGVPQNRERIFIVGFRPDLGIKEEDFSYPNPTNVTKTIRDIIEKEPVSVKYYLSTQYLSCLENHKARNQAKGNGFGYNLYGYNSPYTVTLSARYYKDGSEILINQNGKNPRKLTPRECARLQGFPESYILPNISDCHLYKQFGNSVPTKMIGAVAKNIVEELERLGDIK